MLNDILGLPTFVQGVGDCYPITLLDYSKFMCGAWLLKYDKRHTYTKNEETTNLEALLFADFPCEDIPESLKGNELVKYKIECLILVIAMVTRKVVSFNYQDITFYIGENQDEGMVNRYNYDEFRDVVCKSNIIHEEKIYKSKRIAERAKALKKLKAENEGLGITEIISTIHTFSGISYRDISQYSYFQLQETFGRISALKQHDLTKLFASNGSKCDITNFAKNLKLNEVDESNLYIKASDINGMLS